MRVSRRLLPAIACLTLATFARAAESAPDPAASAALAAQRLAPVAEREFSDCDGCPDMVAIPSGNFWMGSPPSEEDRLDDEVQHEVAIPHPFAIGKTEVTFDQWDACAAAGFCRAVPPTEQGDRGWGRGSRPVIEVSWNDITGADGKTRGFLAWLTDRTGLAYRLPTEAEWEYAARGDRDGAEDSPAFYFGPDRTELCRHEYAFPCFRGEPTTVPVGQRPPNPFGLHDMLGNVAEWVDDCYRGYEGAPPPGDETPPDEECARIVRGGAWVYYLWFSRAAVRDRDQPANRNDHRGFRVARSLGAAIARQALVGNAFSRSASR